MKEGDPQFIFILAALSASGKTKSAEKFGEQVGAPVISLRDDILRPLAYGNGFSKARWWIEAAATDPDKMQLERETWANLIRERASDSDSDTVIVDDLVDPGTPAFLRSDFSASTVVCVAIKTPDELRADWIIQRTRGTREQGLAEQAELDGVKIRAGIMQAIAEADYVIENTGDIQEVVDQLKEIYFRLKNPE